NALAKRLSLEVTGETAGSSIRLVSIGGDCVPSSIALSGEFNIYKQGTLTSLTRAPLGQNLKFTNLTTVSPGVVEAKDTLGDVLRVPFSATGAPVVHMQLATWKAVAVHGLRTKCIFILSAVATDGSTAKWTGAAKDMILP